MRPTSATTTDRALVVWMPAFIGVLSIWKIGQQHFSHFMVVVRQTRDGEKANVQLEMAIQETQVRIVNPLPVVVSIDIEEVIHPPIYSPEATAHHKARMDDVDRLIAAIEAVEEEYWGSSSM